LCKISLLALQGLLRLFDVHRTYIGMIERAEKNITLINIEKITNAPGITLSDLFKFNKK
jgi:hypothetical protein